MNFDNLSKYKLKAVVDCIGKNSTKLGYFDGRNQHIHKKGLKTIQKSCDVRVSINQIKNLIQAKNKILDKGNGVYRISVNAANILQTIINMLKTLSTDFASMSTMLERCLKTEESEIILKRKHQCVQEMVAILDELDNLLNRKFITAKDRHKISTVRDALKNIESIC